MAFLRRSCKNMPGSTDENSMKAMMWRYRDVAGRTQSHLFVLRRPRGTGWARLSRLLPDYMLG
jgi:hypothetical protein